MKIKKLIEEFQNVIMFVIHPQRHLQEVLLIVRYISINLEKIVLFLC